ncbi:MAG: hypothetical protein DMD35_11910 [Gemmatimonadetes bacterium]|nr:MAG: hypothetical protein DMD35_11910 [Gemmatimonadota bacterium]
MRRLLAVVTLSTLAACSSIDSALRDNTVTGTWRGTSTGQSFVLNLQQSNAAVAGTGTITSTAAGTRSLSISGTFNPPAFSGTLTPSGASAITLTAIVESGNTMVGTLTGGGFTGEGIALTRD